MNRKYYLAYGSNLNEEQMAWRCPTASVVGVADLNDWRLLFRGSKTGSYLTIEPCEGHTIPVAIWSITKLPTTRILGLFFITDIPPMSLQR